MRQSEQINELASALAKAQAKMKPAKKNTSNPFFKSQFADLESVVKSCMPHLNEQGISVMQIPAMEEGKQILETILAHSSGQWISGTYPINPVKNDPQGMGSAMSYARRYSLSAMVSQITAEDDDDGEGAMDRQTEGPKVEQKTKTKGLSESGTISEAQIKRLFKIMETAGWNQAEARDLIAKYGYDHSKDIHWEHYQEICKVMEANPKG